MFLANDEGKTPNGENPSIFSYERKFNSLDVHNKQNIYLKTKIRKIIIKYIKI